MSFLKRFSVFSQYAGYEGQHRSQIVILPSVTKLSVHRLYQCKLHHHNVTFTKLPCNGVIWVIAPSHSQRNFVPRLHHYSVTLYPAKQSEVEENTDNTTDVQ